MNNNENTPLLTGTPSISGLLRTSTPPTLEAIATRVGVLSQSDLNALLLMPQISALADTTTLKQTINLALALSQETQSRERERHATTLTRCVVNPILGMGMLANIITILMLVDKQPDGTLAMILGLLVLQVVIAAYSGTFDQ